MIVATNDIEEDKVNYLTLLWIEQNLNTCANSAEIRKKLEGISYECEAEELIQEMNVNRLIPGLHYTPHTVRDQYFAIRYMVDKDNFYER